MYDRAQLIESLGIQAWPEAKQDKAVEIATFRIGSAITDQLSEQQFNEYTAIVDDNQKVIETWLEQNVPDYKQSPVYQGIVDEYDNDPEKNSPAKLFATMAWIQVNVPEIETLIQKTLSTFKDELSRV